MTASLWPLAVITLVFNLGGGLVAPALPLYARSLGADYRDLGLIGASHGLAFAALTIPLGRASDHVGRRAMLLFSALTVGGAAATYLSAGGVLGLAGGKLVEAVGWAGFWPALEAWAAEQFGARAGAAMGVGYAAYAVAFVVGTSVAGFVIEAAGLRMPFVLYLGTAGLTVVLVLSLKVGSARGGRPARHAPTALTPRAATLDPGSARRQRLLAYGTGFVYVFGLGTVLAFLPAYATDRGLAPGGVGLLVGGYWVARATGSLAVGRVVDRLGRRAVLLGTMAVGGGGALLIAIPAGVPSLALGAVGLGLAAGACAPTCVGLIADHVGADARGMAMGLFEASCGVSILMAGLLGGWAADRLGPGMPYLLVASLMLAWSFVLARGLGPLRGGRPV